MLSLIHPEILPTLRRLNYGLLPIFSPSENKFLLAIKATKELILTARTNNEFRIYLVNDIGLIVAFFDDSDEPMAITIPLFAEDELLNDISSLFSQNEFEIYFFDEHTRELMGVKALNNDHARFKANISKGNFRSFNQLEVLKIINQIQERFGSRDNNDDRNAFTIKLMKRLYADNQLIINLREKFHGFNDHEKSVAITSLERRVDPGSMQEKDIALALKRIFTKDIYINPIRVDTGKELTDILIDSDNFILFVQAKDSPNTPEMLNRSINRKRLTIHSHIEKATKQMGGALIYARANKVIELKGERETINLQINGKQLIGLIIVNEMFDDEYPDYSSPVLALVRSLGLPIILLDFLQLHVLTQQIKTQQHFISQLYTIVDFAIANNQFPKSVYSGRDLPSE